MWKIFCENGKYEIQNYHYILSHQHKSGWLGCHYAQTTLKR